MRCCFTLATFVSESTYQSWTVQSCMRPPMKQTLSAEGQVCTVLKEVLRSSCIPITLLMNRQFPSLHTNNELFSRACVHP